ncbi:Alpha/Beta hydrolase protein [Umbelopsis sp. AD052]|nr:Alpha/Beta hydrolase protein [Umbelopsis sp. AD052]
MTIDTFEVPSFTPEQRQKLNEKLSDIIYPHEFEKNVGWTYGAPKWAVEPMVNIWRNEFDWEESRKEMARWHHLKVNIDGVRIHCVNETSKQPGAIPIMLLHGWPSTFYEYHKVIEPLRDGAGGAQAYHVVVPSLPGYGFSDPTPTPGWGVAKCAETLHKLMLELGYTKYVVHGTDWGAVIGMHIATTYTANCRAYHTNFMLVMPPIPTLSNIVTQPVRVVKFLACMLLGGDAVYGKDMLRVLGRSFADIDRDRDSGYRAIQGTKPYSLSYGLSDSPVGLLAWLLEKYHNWTTHTGDKESSVLPPTIDAKEFLTQVTIYWMTNSISSSMRLYYERLIEPNMDSAFHTKVTIPTGVSSFPDEVSKMPREWVDSQVNLVQYEEHPSGGHFAALEEPQLLTHDIQRFGKKIAADLQ